MSTSQHGLWTMTKGEFEDSIRRIEKAIAKRGGNPRKIFDYLRTDPAFITRLAEFMLRGGLEPFITQKVAREIMGESMLGVEEATRYLKRPTKMDLEILEKVPYPEAVLKFCKNAFVLVADLGLSIMNVRSRDEENLFDPAMMIDRPGIKPWSDEVFAVREGPAVWRLVRKNIVPKSSDKSWIDQYSLLLWQEAAPESRVMAYTIILYYLARGERLFPDVYANCADLDSHNLRVSIGNFGPHGLHIFRHSDDACLNYVGLAAELELG